MDDLIKRADAIEALGEEPEIWNDTEEELAYHNAWVEHISALKALPSAEAVSREECDECKTDKEGVLLQQLAELQGDYETMKNAYEDARAELWRTMAQL